MDRRAELKTYLLDGHGPKPEALDFDAVVERALDKIISMEKKLCHASSKVEAMRRKAAGGIVLE